MFILLIFTGFYKFADNQAVYGSLRYFSLGKHYVSLTTLEMIFLKAVPVNLVLMLATPAN